MLKLTSWPLKPVLKNSIFSDKDILENVVLTTENEREQWNKFKGKQINISTTEASEYMNRSSKDQLKTSKPIHIDLHSLKPTIVNLVAWWIDVEQKIAFLSLAEPRQVSSADAKIAKNFEMFPLFYCGWGEHLECACLKKFPARKKKQPKS